MAHLQEHPTLKHLQQYMDEVCKERSWTKDTYAEKFLLFTEEVGELTKLQTRDSTSKKWNRTAPPSK